MTNHGQNNRVLILYIGTRRLAAIVAEAPGDPPRVLRFAQVQHAEGFTAGEVTQFDKALLSVQEILKRLEMGDDLYEIPAYALLSNSHLKMSRFTSSIYYQGYPRAVTPLEVRHVIDQTRSVAPLPLEDWVLQLVPESFWVNDLKGVENPVGLEAQRLAVTLQIFTSNYGSFRNISRLVDSLELNIQGYYPKTVVLPAGVLNPAEKAGETFILDISDEVTHLILTREEKIVQTKSLNFGSRYLTNRIAENWKLGLKDAEVLKERFGSLEEKVEFGEELIPLVERNGLHNHQLKRSEFHREFLGYGGEFFSRLQEEMSMFLAQEKISFPHFVVTGGGVRLDGLLDFLSRKLEAPVRLGTPRSTEGAAELSMDPGWSGVVGLLRWLQTNKTVKFSALGKENLLGRTLVQVKDWLAAYF